MDEVRAFSHWATCSCSGAFSHDNQVPHGELHAMANSRYEYVKGFEVDDRLLPQCWVVLRLDGRAFTKFSAAHGFSKPNDEGALRLMNECALQCCREWPDIVLAYGHSDEFSLVVRKSSQLYDRRASKLVSVVTSFFTSNYVILWPKFLPDKALQSPPSFDGRAVCYPTDAILRDYLAWRQTDCHVNNQYNTCYWNLVQRDGMTPAEAQAALKGTVTKEKNELLFSRFGMNYNSLPAIFKKGSVIYKKKVEEGSGEARADGSQQGDSQTRRVRFRHVIEHVDIISEKFWLGNPHVLC